ncbi:toxin-antitoxin system YwqK family antitoxin [Paraburkholderia sp. IW21]|uniref:toxin-antitoxin system YwqK family antitoxin n=1 Tax=Paraburkholderia sp. IW21 TaxID=3242488 RepID=UPI0035203A97
MVIAAPPSTTPIPSLITHFINDMKFSIHPRSMLLVTTFATALALAGCGDKTLDFRNAEINNGKVYAGDSNTPFTGTLTNVSAGQILGSQSGFAKLVNVVNYDLPSATVGAMGLSSICDVHVEGGWLDGKAICKAPQSDTVRIEASFKDGTLDGDLIVYDDSDKEPFVTVTFKNGLPDGKQMLYSTKTHKLVYVNNWESGILNGEEMGYYADTGNLEVQVNRANGQYDGDLKVYAPDGKQVIHRVTYVTGKKQGPDDQYDAATGKQIGHADWENDQMNGVVKVWDVKGNVTKEVTYDRGVRQPTADEIAAQATADKQAQTDMEANYAKQKRDEAVANCIAELIDKNNPNAPRDGRVIQVRDEEKQAYRQQCEQAVPQASTP